MFAPACSTLVVQDISAGSSDQSPPVQSAGAKRKSMPRGRSVSSDTQHGEESAHLQIVRSYSVTLSCMQQQAPNISEDRMHSRASLQSAALQVRSYPLFELQVAVTPSDTFLCRRVPWGGTKEKAAAEAHEQAGRYECTSTGSGS